MVRFCRHCRLPFWPEGRRIEPGDALTHCDEPACQEDRAALLAYIASSPQSVEIRLDAARELLRRIDRRMNEAGGNLDVRRLYSQAVKQIRPMLRTLRVVRAETIRSEALA